MGTDERRQKADSLIREAAEASGRLTEVELDRVLRHVAAAGFDPLAREVARGPLRGQLWDVQLLTGSSRLPTDARHWLLHVVVNHEWPDGTTLADYIDSLRRVILDPDSGVLINRYQGALSLGVVRESRDLRGPGGQDWILVQYRVSIGHWTTGFQPGDGLAQIGRPNWGYVQWLRGPTIRRVWSWRFDPLKR